MCWLSFWVTIEVCILCTIKLGKTLKLKTKKIYFILHTDWFKIFYHKW